MSVEQRERTDLRPSFLLPHSEGNGGMGELGQVLEKAARERTLAEGIRYDQLGKTEQLRQCMVVARNLYLELAQDYHLRIIERRVTPDEREIRVNPWTIRLTVVRERGETTEVIAPERKVMLAFFSDLTLQKISRCLQPWIHIDDYVSFTQGKYSRDQAYEKLFEFFTGMEIFKVEKMEGYCLNCDPEKLLSILQGNYREYGLDIDQEWYHADTLLEDFVLPTVLAIWEQRPQDNQRTNGRLDVERVMVMASKSKDTIYLHLQKLEEIGLIQRSNNFYFLSDIAWETVGRLIDVNKKPYRPRVKTEKFVYSEEMLAERKPARRQPLEVHRQEYPNPPQVSWGKYGLRVDFEQSFPDREKQLRMIRDVFSANLEDMTVLDSRRRPVVFDSQRPVVFRWPVSKEFTSEQAIVVLNHLGFGPRETTRFLNSHDQTISQAMERLETGNLDEMMFAEVVRARLAGLLLGNQCSPVEARDFPFSDLQHWLGAI